jgi:hypothetical protein
MNFKTAKARLPRRSQPWDERTMNRSARTRARVGPTKASLLKRADRSRLSAGRAQPIPILHFLDSSGSRWPRVVHICIRVQGPLLGAEMSAAAT